MPARALPSIEIRKRSLNIEMIFHEGGPRVSRPILVASACAVIRNPYAGRFEPDLLPFMEAVKPIGASLAEELVRSLGKDHVEAYGKAAIVGVNGGTGAWRSVARGRGLGHAGGLG